MSAAKRERERGEAEETKQESKWPRGQTRSHVAKFTGKAEKGKEVRLVAIQHAKTQARGFTTGSYVEHTMGDRIADFNVKKHAITLCSFQLQNSTSNADEAIVQLLSECHTTPSLSMSPCSKLRPTFTPFPSKQPHDTREGFQPLGSDDLGTLYEGRSRHAIGAFQISSGNPSGALTRSRSRQDTPGHPVSRLLSDMYKDTASCCGRINVDLESLLRGSALDRAWDRGGVSPFNFVTDPHDVAVESGINLQTLTVADRLGGIVPITLGRENALGTPCLITPFRASSFPVPRRFLCYISEPPGNPRFSTPTHRHSSLQVQVRTLRSLSMYSKLALTFAAVFTAVQVSGMALAPSPVSSLTRRGTCDPICGKVATVDQQCKAAPSYEKCACTVDNFNALDDCITCLIVDLQANEAANALLTGGDVVGISGTTAESIRQQGDTLEKQIIQACAAAGVPIGASTSSGSTSGGSTGNSGTSGGSTTGGTTSGSTSGGATGGTNAGSTAGGSASGSTTTTPESSVSGLSNPGNSASTNGKVVGVAFAVALAVAATLM
ncbi:hypothetical protein NMY22_g15265 [Coprinellus aureogranulatus]|nr:hypothetical protein NMY22_g15265 [Coprinellus aureogranulatus]